VPVVRTRVSRLAKLLGIDDLEKLREVLFNLKCETELEEEEIAIEVQSDRIDMFSTEGIVYAIKLYLGVERPKIIVPKTIFRVRVEPPSKRPYIAIAAVKGVDLDKDSLKELIEFQERLHTTYGRNRRKIAIGLHDLSKLPSYDITYKEVDIYTTHMIPLFSTERFSVKEVLESTEQGKLYGWISLNNSKHPALFSGEEIIALPPVINSNITRLEPSTRDIFIDVTGTDINAVMNVLNAIVYTLSYYGGEVIGAEVIYPNNVVVTPDLIFKVMHVDIDFASKWLGISKDILVIEAPRALQRMGYIVESIDMEHVEVKVPPYRCDVLHQVDVVEDIAIGIGYDKLGLEYVQIPHERKTRRNRKKLLVECLREALIGLGYIEINTLSLVSSNILSFFAEEPFPQIVNAVSGELDALRNSLVPSLLTTFKNSQYAILPVKIFEIGEVVEKCSECYNGWRNSLRIAFGIMDSEIRFEEIHADLYAIMAELGIGSDISLEAYRKRGFIDGRCGLIKHRDRAIGVVGEVHPEVLKSIGLEYPIAVVELYTETLMDTLSEKYLD
jgi:phenylalanyl-tRNA synthetase beta chain